MAPGLKGAFGGERNAFVSGSKESMSRCRKGGVRNLISAMERKCEPVAEHPGSVRQEN